MNDILNMPVDARHTPDGIALKTAQAVGKDNYSQLISHQNLRTYSTTEVFHACPREYSIQKMKADAGTAPRQSSTTFAFGHAVGAGVAVYDKTQDLRQALWAAFLSWDVDLLEEETNKQGKRTGKSFHEACWALYNYRTFYEEETDLSDYEVIKIEGTIVIDFEDGHFYSGHIDELLRNKYTGTYRVKENKTTGLSSIDPALYSNSDQALSYAVVIDMLGGAEYEVLYTIYSSSQERWVQFSFVKPLFKKSEWLQDQLLINQQIDTYKELKFFPKRGRSCIRFMRRCSEYETCDIALGNSYGKEFQDLPKIDGVAAIEKLEHVDYMTTLSEIVQRQRERLNHD